MKQDHLKTRYCLGDLRSFAILSCKSPFLCLKFSTLLAIFRKASWLSKQSRSSQSDFVDRPENTVSPTNKSSNPNHATGLSVPNSLLYYKDGILTAMKTCTIEGCDRKHWAKGMCQRHYSQIYSNGQISQRTRSDLNEVTIKGDLCIIQAYDRQDIPTVQILIDAEDYDRIRKYKWYTKNNHGHTRALNTQVGYLSRFIMGVTDPKIQVDHINHDTLDNRKRNLRLCSHPENQRNMTVNRKNNVSGYKGVHWDRRRNKWSVQIKINGSNIYIGSFNSKEQAALAYNQAAIKFHKEFALLNDVSEHLQQPFKEELCHGK